MRIKVSRFTPSFRTSIVIIVSMLVSAFTGIVARAEVIKCGGLFAATIENGFLPSATTQVGLIQIRSRSTTPVVKQGEKNPVISSSAEAEMIKILKEGTGPNLLLDEIDINTKGAWGLLVSRKTTIAHIDEVMEVIATTVDGFRQTKGIDHAKVLMRIKSGLIETLKESISRMSDEEVAIFVTQMRGILLEKATDYWDLMPIISHLSKVPVPGSGWIVMLAEVKDLVLREERPGKRRDQMTSGLFALISESFKSLTQMSNLNLDRYFQYAINDKRLLIPLLKSKVVIPEIFHYGFVHAFNDLLSEMNSNNAGDGFLIAKELQRRGIVKKEALRFVNLVIEHGTVFVEDEGLKMFQNLKTELQK